MMAHEIWKPGIRLKSVSVISRDHCIVQMVEAVGVEPKKSTIS